MGYVRGISSRSITNVNVCGGDSKSGLVPRQGMMVSGVRNNIGRGKLLMTCMGPRSNAYYNVRGPNLG